MELQFQTQPKEVSKQRERKRNTNNKTKFVGVRQRPSGKWVAEIKNTTQKIRMWLGTFDTAEEAARAYDEAACLLRGSNTRTNFVDQIPPNSALSLKIRNLLHQKKCQKQKPTKTIITQNNTTKISSYNGCSNNITSPNGSSLLKQDVQVFTDAYKPDLSNFNGGFEMGNSQFDYSSSDFDVMSTGFYGIVSNQEDGFEVPKISSISDVQIPDYERMKVERQISASLYAMNGVNEYWENVHDCSADGFWDLPMMCQMFYLS